jgi:hypothetical protein
VTGRRYVVFGCLLPAWRSPRADSELTNGSHLCSQRFWQFNLILDGRSSEGCGSEELTAKPYETWPPPQAGTITPPYEDYLGRPSYEVCPNCGFEFGNDDNPGGTASSFAEYRAEWTARGSLRFWDH